MRDSSLADSKAPFAEDLAKRIKGEPDFQKDINLICASALRRMISGLLVEDTEALDVPIDRLLYSASILAQTSSMEDWSLAQDIALYCILSSKDSRQREVGRRILSQLGNFPGLDQLATKYEFADPSLMEYISERLLRKINTVNINNEPRVLTDYQRDVWAALKGGESLAISAPTSAGKSYVVLEYLAQLAIDRSKFIAVYIAPTRALLGEISEKLGLRLKGHEKKIRVSTVPTPDVDRRDNQIFVLTQERLQVLLVTLALDFDLVVVDEAQAINEASRGVILQDCLEQLRSRSPRARFMFLAPGATGFDQFEVTAGIDNIVIKETRLSPVLQNRIIVMPNAAASEQNRLRLALLTEVGSVDLGVVNGSRGFGNPDTALAAVALELGMDGASLVYGSGPAATEEIAASLASDPALRDLAKAKNRELVELSAFIEKHIHREYSLAKQVLCGVGAHYGKMPSLLREALEENFKQGKLRYLVCTTTLFQGVNLPARNVFINTPTRGRGDHLDAASLWNFAGRAGRLGKEFVGNVFLIGYDSWDVQPFTKRERFEIKPSFKEAVISDRGAVLECLKSLDKRDPGSTPSGSAWAAAGLLVARSADGSIERLLDRSFGDALPAAVRDEIAGVARGAFKEMGLPAAIVKANWTIDGFALSALYERLKRAIKEGEADDIIPVHPSSTGPDPGPIYYTIFRRINHYVLGLTDVLKWRSFNNKVTYTALSWMRGLPLPAIIDEAIKWRKKKGEGKKNAKRINYDSLIREVFEFIEDELRFKYVQLGRAYIDVLSHALVEEGRSGDLAKIYNFPLALELGVSTTAGQVFVELGLSRITSSTLESIIPDSNPTTEKARVWLSSLTGGEYNFSAIIWQELRDKGFVSISAEGRDASPAL